MKLAMFVLATAAALVVVVGSAAAPAAKRAVTINDPRDSKQAFGKRDPDLKSVTITYDPAGEIRVDARLYAPVPVEELADLAISFSIGGMKDDGLNGSECASAARAPMADGTIFFDTELPLGFLNMAGFSDDLQTTSVTTLGRQRVIGIFRHRALSGRPFRCAAATQLWTSYYSVPGCYESGCPRDNLTYDEVNIAKWFPGFKPK